MKTGDRRISATASEFSTDEAPPGTTGVNESDSNADTCCLGRNFCILSYTNRVVDVFAYDTAIAPKQNIPIVSGATAYTCPYTDRTFILVFHESLFYGSQLDHSLINPNQVRHNGIDLWDNPFDPLCPLSIAVNGGLTIDLSMIGTKLQFETRVPTQKELSECEHIEMTCKLPWNPHSVILCEANTLTPRQYDTSEIEHFEESKLQSISSVFVALKEQSMKHMIQPVYVDVSHDDIPSRRTFTSNERHKRKSAEDLSELWCIGKSRAMATLDATTQRGTRSALLPLSRRYQADRRYNVNRLKGKFATDTLYAEVKSIHGNKYAQVYSLKNGFATCYPMEYMTGESLGITLKDFCHDFGVPEHLTLDGFSSQVGKRTTFMQVIRNNDIKIHVSEPYRPNQNPAESTIRELKKRWYRIMLKKKVPKRLWDYGLVWICETGNLTVSSSRYAHGRTPLELVTGDTPDISEYTDFCFYDWVTFRTNGGLSELSVGRWLGVAHKIGPFMSYYVLPESGIPVSSTTVQRITNAECLQPEWIERFNKFNTTINKRLDPLNHDNVKEMTTQPDWNRLSLNDEDNDFVEEFNRVISDNTIPEQDDYTEDTFDGYLKMEIGLPRGDDDELHHAKVKRRAVDEDGRPVGKSNKNPLLDTRQYEVEFHDGTIEILSANIIAENILAQVDEEGHRQMFLREIIDHRHNPNVAIPKEKGYYQNQFGTRSKVRTTKGWELCVEWRDGSTDWIALKDLKNTYPVELARYAQTANLTDEPAFAWWVPYTLKKQQRILAKLKSKYWDRTHKYGIRMPKSVQEAYAIDKEEGNTLWHDAIEQEMKKIKQAFKEYDGNPEELIGYQKITTHFIFDIKLGENFRRKARLVGDGHKTKTPSSVTYSSVVSRDSVRICLLLAALNDLDLQSADIENAYLTAPCREKVWTVGGPEFGSGEGKNYIIVKALYGLRSSGAAFRAFLAETLDKIGFKSSLADPDVWLRAATKADGEEYYEYILVYVDDILCISQDAKVPMREIMQSFKFKKDLIEPPQIYLGARLEEKSLNGRKMWTMSSRDYVKAIIKNLEERLQKKGWKKLPSRNVKTPMEQSYTPELDPSEELEPEDITMFQELIGELRWAIEIGRVDIHTEVAMLSAYQASPRRGHLEQVIHIYAYLRKYEKLTLYFDPQIPILTDIVEFDGNTKEAFKDQYRNAIEEIPTNMPKPRGRSITTTAYVDASHAANKVTRRSHTGYIIFVNRAPIIWFSKRQNTVESSTFSSEFIALKTCMEHIVALRYKLRMFGVPVETATDVLCDNQSVVNNTSKVESMLNKKHNAIAYHAVRWAVAAGTIRVGKILGDLNLSDAMTKRLTSQRREFLFGSWTY